MRVEMKKRPTQAEAAIERYLAHARKFGTESVMETAAEELGVVELTRLRIALDAIEEAKSKAARFGVYKKPRLTARQRVMRLLGLEEETEV